MRSGSGPEHAEGDRLVLEKQLDLFMPAWRQHVADLGGTVADTVVDEVLALRALQLPLPQQSTTEHAAAPKQDGAGDIHGKA